jgi:protein-disulfide isomerase
MHRLLLATTLCLLGTTSIAGGLGEMTAEERAAFRAEVTAFLLDNPEVIVEAMDVLQQRQDAAAADRDVQFLTENHDALFNDAASWVGGNPDGDVTLIEFTDYRCGYCRKAHDEVAELIRSDGNIRFIVKEFPILGDASMISSRFAIAVLQMHGPDQYKAAHDALITLRGEPDEATLTRLATDMGLDPAAVLLRMGSEEVTAVIAANHALADAMQISGTPTFVIKGQMLRGYVPLDGMRKIVADERAG